MYWYYNDNLIFYFNVCRVKTLFLVYKKNALIPFPSRKSDLISTLGGQYLTFSALFKIIGGGREYKHSVAD